MQTRWKIVLGSTALLCSISSLLLTIFASISPPSLLHQTALLTITPSTALRSANANASSQRSVDGPTVWMGLFGSCSRSDNSADTDCTKTAFYPEYDFSKLPKNAQSFVLTPPPSSLAVAIVISITLTFLSLISICLSYLRFFFDDLETFIEKPSIQYAIHWCAIVSLLFGLTVFVVLNMWCDKTRVDFNAFIKAQDQLGPPLIASFGNAFILVWIAYGLLVIPFIYLSGDYWRVASRRAAIAKLVI